MPPLRGGRETKGRKAFRKDPTIGTGEGESRIPLPRDPSAKAFESERRGEALAESPLTKGIKRGSALRREAPTKEREERTPLPVRGSGAASLETKGE